ncbi:glycoside-pentoside-hexuronide (GPH):cation symporter [Actinomyces culturomici]|uniref:glycoside-pentoside-hexuronide (GPH):cation symporter n=1 Tax=Actinomyces culturomici TaxID=1926276 RepID=UPI000E1FBEF6|nr:glycoside-pentoside-hexuronide (GPH):cation symporter [Actinomyces culturomici]
MELTTRTGRGRKFGYGVGAVGKDMVYALVSGFILYFYNDVLGASGTFIGVMMMAARVFDAFNDPIMGVIVEKTRTRWGRFRPWIFTGTLTNALVLYAMFAVPKGMEGSALLTWMTVAYFLWGITYTLMDIPFWSMIPAITRPGKEREAMAVIGRTFAALGFAVPTIATMLVVVRVGSGERDGFAFFAAAVAVFFVVAELVMVVLVKEDVGAKTDADGAPGAAPAAISGAAEPERSPRISEMFRALLANDQAMVVVIGIVVFNASLYLTTQLAVYFFKYDMGNSDLVSLFGAVGGAGQILSMASLPLLRKKWSAKTILSGSISITILGYLLLFAMSLAGVRQIAALALCAFIIYIGFGLATVLTTVFLADSVDYGEYKTGRRDEAVIFSMQTFVVKLASAVSVLLAGVGLDVIGLDPAAATQTAGTLMGLRVLMMIVPIAGIAFALVFLRRRYRLDEAELARIGAAIGKDVHEAGAGASAPETVTGE